MKRPWQRQRGRRQESGEEALAGRLDAAEGVRINKLAFTSLTDYGFARESRWSGAGYGDDVVARAIDP